MVSEINGARCLRHANIAPLSNLLATRIRTIVKSNEKLLAQERDFFCNVLSPKQDEVLTFFEATAEKLESEDIVMCF